MELYAIWLLDGTECPNGSTTWATLIGSFLELQCIAPKWSQNGPFAANLHGMAPSHPPMAPAGAIMDVNRAVFACIWAPSCFKWSQSLKWLPRLPQKLL